MKRTHPITKWLIAMVTAVAMMAALPVSPAAADDDPLIETIDTGGVGAYSSSALTSDGRLVVSYYDATNDNLKLAVCDDAVCSGSTVVTVDSSASVGEFTSLALDEDDAPVISYRDFTNGALKVAFCDALACGSPTFVTVDTGGVGLETSLALNADGVPVIAYVTLTGALKIAVCDDATCAEPDIETLDEGEVQGPSLALTSTDLPVIAFHNESDGRLELATCADVICETSSTNTVDNVGDVGAYSSIVLDADGHPVISYHDNTLGNLNIAFCDDAACTSASTSALDETGDVGEYTSLELTSDGYPVISYHDPSTKTAEIVQCADMACVASSATTVDMGGVGRYTSLALTSAGDPVMSYYDFSTMSLKVGAICASNDLFECAEEIPAEALPAMANGSSVGFGDQPDEATGSCVPGGAPVDSAWWTWTPTEAGVTQVSTEGSGFDTILNIWSGAELASLVEVTCNDDGNGGIFSEASFDAVADTTYWFQVRGFNSGDEGTIQLELCGPKGFTDVVLEAFYEPAVAWAVCEGITTGTSDTEFSPSGTVTRGQLATFLWRFAGSPVGFTHDFEDVPDGAFYEDAVAWMVTQGITTGTSETTFSPDDPITRAQLAVFLWRFEGEPAGFSHDFDDVVEDSFYEAAVAWMAGTGITTGTTPTTFEPKATLTRAQSVTFLWRYAHPPAPVAPLKPAPS